MTPHVNALLRYYAQNYSARDLPWRRPAEPIARVAMVEGLLAMTQAKTVARWYGAVFMGIREPEHWLALSELERCERVAALGLASQKFRALDSIAEALIDRSVLWPIAMETYAGVGPYTAGMIGLLHGAHAAPVDTNVERVGRRAAADGDPARWIGELTRAARGCAHSRTGYPPGYEAACAVMDIGATRCRPEGAECTRCPLGNLCASRETLDRQAHLTFSDPPPRWHHWHGHIEVEIINLDVEDWVARTVTLEGGWRGAAAPPLGESPPGRLLRQALGSRFLLSDTGQVDLRGTVGAHVAQQVADQLPGDSPWCRVVLDDGVGAVTAWGIGGDPN
jgi:A/G-specific adenine glycosylase